MENKDEFHLEEVDHSYIRYANVWEDPYLLSEGLQAPEGGKTLSIASAGDNAFSLLLHDPSIVVAIDLNKTQLYLTELKREAIKRLDREKIIEFLGFAESKNRWEIYQSIAPQLQKETQNYWSKHKATIENGIITEGKFEKYLASFANKILPLIHNKRKIQELFEQKSEGEQKQFYDSKWNSRRWRFLFKIFFSKKVMGIFGRDPAFLEQVEVNVGTTIMTNAGNHISTTHAQNNPFLYYCLKGNFGENLPRYLLSENYIKIKSNIDKLELHFGYAQEAATKYGKFNSFNLSNIFEYMNPEVFKLTTESMIESAAKGARFAYWNLMVPRVMSEVDNRLVRIEDQQEWAKRDQGFFYKQFVAEQLVK